MSLGLDYTGVDPSVCMRGVYPRIIDALHASWGDSPRPVVLHKGFEDTTAKEIAPGTFDMVFSSPLFFALETYDDNNPGQSIRKFSKLSEWKTKFLDVVIQKSYRSLKPGACSAST